MGNRKGWEELGQLCQTRTGIPLTAQQMLFFSLFFFCFILVGVKKCLRALSSSLPVLIIAGLALEQVAEAPLPLLDSSMFPPKPVTDLLCLWPDYGCPQPSGQASSCANLYKKPPPGGDLLQLMGLLLVEIAQPLRGKHSSTQKLLTADVYCIFLKRYLFVNLMYV